MDMDHNRSACDRTDVNNDEKTKEKLCPPTTHRNSGRHFEQNRNKTRDNTVYIYTYIHYIRKVLLTRQRITKFTTHMN